MPTAVKDRQGTTVIVPHSNGRSRKHESTVTTFPMPARLALMAIGLVKRLSQAKTTEALQVDALDRQDVTEAAEASGPVYVHRVYEDPNHSGSKKNVERPAFELAVRDLMAGVIVGLAVLDIDRLTRRHLVLELLIDWYEDHPEAFWYCDDPRCDLTTKQGRAYARKLVDEAAAYAEACVVKATRRHAQARRAGIVVGARGYGHTTRGQVIPEEQANLQRMADAVEAGGNLAGFIAGLEADGVRTTRGSAFKHSTIRRLLTNPRMVGLRVDGNAPDGWAVDDQGLPVQGRQAPLLDYDQWLRIRKLYAANQVDARYRKYLCSEVLHCMTCGGDMNGGPRKAGSDIHRYWCQAPKGGCSYRAVIHGPETDAYVKHLVRLQLMKDTPAVVEAQPWPKADALTAVLQRREAHRAKRDTADPMAWLDTDEALSGMVSDLRQEQRVWHMQHPEPENQPTNELLAVWDQAVAADDVPAMRRVLKRVIRRIDVAPGHHQGRQLVQWSETRLTVIPQAQA